MWQVRAILSASHHNSCGTLTLTTTEAIVAHAIMFTERMKMDTVDVAHIFEAKTREGFLLAAEYVITLLKQWCQITGCVRWFQLTEDRTHLTLLLRKAHARAVLTYQYTWQFYSYHAPVDGRKARVQYLRDLRFRLTLDDIDTILGLLLDLVCCRPSQVYML